MSYEYNNHDNVERENWPERLVEELNTCELFAGNFLSRSGKVVTRGVDHKQCIDSIAIIARYQKCIQ